jgi:hypothetical protein
MCYKHYTISDIRLIVEENGYIYVPTRKILLTFDSEICMFDDRSNELHRFILDNRGLEMTSIFYS